MTTETNKWHISNQRVFEYEIVSCSNLFDPQNETLLSLGKRENTRRFIIVDANVEKYYSTIIRDYFIIHNVDTKIVTFPGGEENKSLNSYISILNELDLFPIIRRDEPIIAIGGGVLTDLVGFVASSYRRGVPHIKIPTTLMGYVDASVGIKTGINFNGNKNRLGSFEPPLKVFLDKTFLKTLPKRHILNGVCEIIKLAVIKDMVLFEMLETHGLACIESKFQDEISESMLARSIEGMIEELEPNLFEDDLERKVDFGHTFSYGLETYPNSNLLHGESVVIDIVISAILAKERNLLSEFELNRILNLIPNLGIIINCDFISSDLLWDSMKERVFHRNGHQRIPLPNGIGKCIFVNDVQRTELQYACDKLENWMEIHDPIREY